MQSVPGNSAAIQAAGYVGWSLDVRDRDSPRFQYFTSHDELQAHLLAIRPGEAEGDFFAFFGDILHAIETFAAEVVSWVVDVANSLLHLVIQVADEIIQLAAIAIKSIEDAIPFIHAIFNPEHAVNAPDRPRLFQRTPSRVLGAGITAGAGLSGVGRLGSARTVPAEEHRSTRSRLVATGRAHASWRARLRSVCL
jgi:hypothetical protein